MGKFYNFENANLIKAPYVEIDGQEYEVQPAEYEGNPLTAGQLDTMQNNIDNLKADKTLYADRDTTTINSLNTDGTWRINIAQNSTDAIYLGWYGNILVETFAQENSNTIIQRFTEFSTGKQKIRYTDNGLFSYNNELFEPFVNKTGSVLTGNLIIGDENKSSSSEFIVANRNGSASFVLNTSGNHGLWSNIANKWIILMQPNGVGLCNVNAISATSDAEGNNIPSTYIKKKNIATGEVSITPSAADTPTSKIVTWSAMDGKPVVTTSAISIAPGTVILGTSASSISSTGATIWLTRSSTTESTATYIAVYK